jgi:hypothetical protein
MNTLTTLKTLAAQKSPMQVAGWFLAGAALVGALTTYLVFWDKYGWVTQAAYAQDEAAEEAIHSTLPTKTQITNLELLMIDLKAGQDRGWDRWECDEIDEAVPELQEALRQAETDAEEIRIQRKIKKQDERWVDLDCSQFTE